MNQNNHTPSKPETASEERANTITHGIGVLLSIVALIVMIKEALNESIWHVVSVSIFGACLILLYLSSTIYHGVTGERVKGIFRVIDHCFIFVLIAGSYMPWVLVNLRGPWGWSIFGIIWGLAIFGIVLKTVSFSRFKKLGLINYLLMGWLICIAIKPLLANISPKGLTWLVFGGVAYTVGVVFFLMRNLKYSHAIWHLFVLAGSSCHVMAVLAGVMPHK